MRYWFRQDASVRAESPGWVRTTPRFVRVSRSAASEAILSAAGLHKEPGTCEANLSRIQALDV